MRTTHCQPLLASMLLLAGYQPNLLAEHILKRGEAEILGYKLSKTAFLSCDQETISIQHDDVISKAPGTRKCSNGPGPILAQAEILHVNEFEKTVTVKC